MRNKLTALYAVSTCLLLIISLSSCQLGLFQHHSNDREELLEDAQPVTIRIAWWGGDNRHEYTRKVIELYETLNQHVSFDIEEYNNYDDYWKRMAPQAAAAELPDIVQIDTSYYAQYAGKKLFAELTPYFGQEIDITNISENVLRAGWYDGGNYGITLGINALGFQYDPELLKKAGFDQIPKNWTWDDYVRIATKAKAAGLYMDDGMRPEIFFAYYLRTKGKTLYNEEGTGLGYNDDSLFVDFFGRLIGLVHNKSVPTVEEKSQIKGFSDNYLTKSKQIGIWQWSNQYLAMQQAVDRPMEIAPMVGPNMEKGLYLKSSMFFSIAETSKVKSEAAKFINFWINDIEANKMILGERGVPISSVVQEAIKPVLSESEKQVFDYVAWSELHSSPGDSVDPIGSAEIIEKLKQLWEQMEYEQITVEQAALMFRQDASAILAKNMRNNRNEYDD